MLDSARGARRRSRTVGARLRVSHRFAPLGGRALHGRVTA